MINQHTQLEKASIFTIARSKQKKKRLKRGLGLSLPKKIDIDLRIDLCIFCIQWDRANLRMQSRLASYHIAFRGTSRKHHEPGSM